MRPLSFPILTICSALLLAACGGQVATASLKDGQEPATLPMTADVGAELSPLATSPAPAVIDNSPTITATIAAEGSDEAPDNAWLIYQDPRGFMFEYPADWEIYRISDVLNIRTPLTATVIPPEGVNVDFYYPWNESIEEILRPDYGTPNEGGYRRFWITRFPIEDGFGWMYVWGDYDSARPHGGLLYISFYNETYNALVTLFTGFATEDVALAETVGIETTVRQAYPKIQQIIESFRFLPPLATPTPWPTP